ncbi:hypothetical protein R1flu_029286 [Riccia fluitans]|uniref:Uncharacterized protein n=1 Tax=Riccia fluitans TaxID=41844 RepID=A0ABD1XPR8_9MARC
MAVWGQNNEGFSGTAVDNRMKRREKITPFMRWAFKRDLLRMFRNIRNIKPSIDQGPPKQPSPETIKCTRRIVEDGRLRVIEKENQELLGRLRNIHNRPQSHFCHMKKKGDYLIKGDAFRLKKPSKAGYLVRLYKDLKLENPIMNRKSIRVQQEMLTSAMELVQLSSRSKPTEEVIDNMVQLTLDSIEEPSPPGSTFDSGAASDSDKPMTLEGKTEASPASDAEKTSGK